jgi:heme exporter protein CcmD
MSTHFHFIVASYAVFALAIVIEVTTLILNRRKALNAIDVDNE